MPELPEVETIARLLRPALIGRRIVGASLLWERTLAQPAAVDFAARITGQVFQDIGRRGKFLRFGLSQDMLLIHLRMSGDLFIEPSLAPIPTHHRLLLDLDNALGGQAAQRLAFNDARKFGRVWLTNDPQAVLGGLGPEPLDETFTPQELFQRLQTSRRQLKPLLLDQTFLAGMGNIYVDEALHVAKLHPLTPANTLSPEQATDLWRAIREVLLEGIQRNGASIDWVYRGGDFQNHFRVYQRTGQPCPACGALVQRIVVGQRGTHFCPHCQVLRTECFRARKGV
jgi:formamidopyrimidine-DNA glycosylase